MLAAAGGAFCFSAALGLLYATLAPPLSGPDEPYHLLAYAALGGDTRVSRETMSWIQLTHLAAHSIPSDREVPAAGRGGARHGRGGPPAGRAGSPPSECHELGALANRRAPPAWRVRRANPALPPHAQRAVLQSRRWRGDGLRGRVLDSPLPAAPLPALPAPARTDVLRHLVLGCRAHLRGLRPARIQPRCDLSRRPPRPLDGTAARAELRPDAGGRPLGLAVGRRSRRRPGCPRLRGVAPGRLPADSGLLDHVRDRRQRLLPAHRRHLPRGSGLGAGGLRCPGGPGRRRDVDERPPFHDADAGCARGAPARPRWAALARRL